MNPLQSRLFALRRRLRFVVTFRGGCWLLAILLGCAALGGALDWNVHLPALVRACILVGTLSAVVYVGYRYLVLPLWNKTDDLSLALRVENCFPVLNDALASTVQFLERPAGGPAGDSPSLRREAVQRAVRQAQGCDFNKAVNARGLRRSGLTFFVAAALGLYLMLFYPALAWTALARLADPFGGHDWPTQTQLVLEDYPTPIPAGQPFVIQGSLSGVIPETVSVEFKGLSISARDYPVKLSKGDKEGDDTGTFTARVDMSRQQGDFYFRVRANDAVSPANPREWHKVEVVQPPDLASLQARLVYPAYTDLPPEELPSGYDNVDAVLGTRLVLKGVLERRVVRAWVEFPSVKAGVPGKQLTANLTDKGTKFEVSVLPEQSGKYHLRWRDREGVGQFRTYTIKVKPDPAPEVKLECLSLAPRSKEVTARAVVTLRTRATDEEYAVKSVWLEYRRKDKTGKDLDENWRRVPLYDHEAAGQVAPRLVLAGVTGLPLTEAGAALRMRVKQVNRVWRWSLQGLAEAGNVLLVRAAADDFDDVTPGKQPGRSSPPLELQIVTPEELKPVIQEAMRQVRDELVRLNEMQEKALKLVKEAEKELRNNGKLSPDDEKKLIDARAEQNKIQERIGKDKQEGLQKEADRIRRLLEDNKLPRSEVHDKIDNVAKSLRRLARDRLSKIDDLLEKARQAAEDPEGTKRQTPAKRTQDLRDARRNQEEVQKTLEGLLTDLTPFVTIQEMQARAQALKREQEQLRKETRELEQQPNKDLRKTEQDRLADRQKRLAERTKKLRADMDKVSTERQETNPHMSEILDKAGKRAAAVEGQMKEAEDALKKGQENKAEKDQQGSIKGLEDVIGAMDERHEERMDRLKKRQKKEQKKLDELNDRMDRLKKKVQDIKKKMKEGGQDAAQLGKEMKKLAGEQKQIQQEVDQMVRRLSRLQADEAVQQLRRASRRMEEAARKMEDGEDPEKKQEQALDRLDDAQEKLQKANNRVENELARQKLAKIADEIKGLKKRQDAAITESVRIHKVLEMDRTWGPSRGGLLSSLMDLKKIRQQGLITDTETLKMKLEGAPVFSHILDRAVRAMKKAGDRMQERHQAAVDRDAMGERQLNKEEIAEEDRANAETLQYQRDASQRLQRLLDALKQDAGGAPPKAGQKQQTPPEADDAPPPPNRDGIPTLAELKALKAEEQDVHERTAAFATKHPELDNLKPEEKLQKLDPKGKIELTEIYEDQKKVRELAVKLFTAAKKQGEDQ